MPKPRKRVIDAMRAGFDLYNAEKVLDNNMLEILKERFSYTDMNGKEWVVEGEKQNPEKGTYGYLDVFATPEYMGQPFHEVSRNMFSHFKAYCVSRGMTEAELQELTSPGMTDEMKNKLRDYKNDFMKMVFDKDLDKISDMYVFYAKEIEKDSDLFKNFAVDDPEGIKNNVARLLKYGGAQSWYAQTINYKASSCTEAGNKMVEMVDEKLAKEGKSYKFENMFMPLYVAESMYAEGRSMTEENFKDEPGQKYKKVIVGNRLVNSYISSYRDELAEAESKEGGWLSHMGDQSSLTKRVNKYFEMDDKEFDKNIAKYKSQNELNEFSEAMKSGAMKDNLDSIIGAIEESGNISHRDSDLSGKLYQQLIAIRDKNAEGLDIADDEMSDLKKTATEYLSYKNKKGYNKNALGKIAAADGILSFVDAFERKDASLVKEISTEKNAVDKIMEAVGANESIAKVYEEKKEKVSYTDLLKNEIKANTKKENKKTQPEAKKEKSQDMSKSK